MRAFSAGCSTLLPEERLSAGAAVATAASGLGPVGGAGSRDVSEAKCLLAQRPQVLPLLRSLAVAAVPSQPARSLLRAATAGLGSKHTPKGQHLPPSRGCLDSGPSSCGWTHTEGKAGQGDVAG